MVASSLLDLIGDTPLVELPRLSPAGVRIFAKLEGQPDGAVRALRARRLDDLGAVEP